MTGRRRTLAVPIATFVTVAVVATLVLGNVVYADSCGAGWTGYVPLGSCVKTFWSGALLLGPTVGLLAGACAALLTRRAASRRPEAQ
ncbi:MAG TPA: hypothetical protein VMU65_11985 [Candidatus Saccharimonadales bacterium]|jgi:hypothetical protein|nr:hypothetical protein [Candidatus Saccharimonadales bacterium]